MDIAQFRNRHKLQTENSSAIPLSKKISRNRWFKVFKPVIPILIFILIVVILTWVGVFKIKKIENGTQLEYVKNLEQTTNQYLGEGYFSLDLEKLENEIVKSDGYVRSVTSQKIFPNKVELTVLEHIPSYYLEYKEVCYIFSQEGLMLESMEEYEECKVEKGIELIANQNIIAQNGLIFDTEISQVVKVLQEFSLNISTIEVQENVLILSDGEKEIIVGTVADFETQLAKLYLVLEKINIEGLEYSSLDMRFERPIMELL